MATKKVGFGADPVKDQERRDKSLATRRANKVKKEAAFKKASAMRKEAGELRARATTLEEDADSIDGQNSSTKNKRKADEKLAEQITDMYGDTVSSQYLKQVIKYAILRGKRPEEIITPTLAAMDILHDLNSSPVDKNKAMVMLQQYESAKPALREEEVATIGNSQEEMDSLMNMIGNVGPREVPQELLDVIHGDGMLEE